MLPLHVAVLIGCVVTTGRWLTVIVMLAWRIQPAPLLWFTVYVVVVIGEAATGFVVVELKPVAGLQRNVPVVTGARLCPVKVTDPLKFLGLFAGVPGATGPPQPTLPPVMIEQPLLV